MATKKRESKRCPACRQGSLKASHAADELTVGGHQFLGSVPARKCSRCGEIFFDPVGLRAFELAVASVLASHGARSGETFRFMRKALGMKAVDLAKLLDATPETLSRWEKGKLKVDRRAFTILASLVKDKVDGKTTTLETIIAMRHPIEMARKVRIPKVMNRKTSNASPAFARFKSGLEDATGYHRGTAGNLAVRDVVSWPRAQRRTVPH
jgi:putative zinc finger/helix-turn-helix YgiT family protein